MFPDWGCVNGTPHLTVRTVILGYAIRDVLAECVQKLPKCHSLGSCSHQKSVVKPEPPKHITIVDVMTWKCHTSVAAGSSHGHGELSYSFGHLTRSEVERGCLMVKGLKWNG